MSDPYFRDLYLLTNINNNKNLLLFSLLLVKELCEQAEGIEHENWAMDFIEKIFILLNS